MRMAGLHHPEYTEDRTVITGSAPRWLSSWDEYGTSLDSERTVPVTVGILAPEQSPTLAIAAAGELVVLDQEAVARFGDYARWAAEEYEKLRARAPRSEAAEATLNHAQWRAIKDALEVAGASAALRELRAAAPEEWRDETAG